MKSFQKSSGSIGHSTPASPTAIILLLFFANLTICSGSISKIANGFPKEMRSFPAIPSESPQTINSCAKTPTHCSSLCQTDLLAGTRAKELEEYSRKTRIDADKATQRAASTEKQANKKLRKMGLSVNKGGSGAVNSKDQSSWKIVEIVPRLFVSNEARSRADRENKEAKKFRTNPPPNSASQEALELLVKLQMATKTAEEAQKVADDAEREADQARSYADSVRQSYKNCLSGKESQFNSR